MNPKEINTEEKNEKAGRPPIVTTIISIHQIIGVIFIFLIFWKPVCLLFGMLYFFLSGFLQKPKLAAYRLYLFTAQLTCLYFIVELIKNFSKINVMQLESSGIFLIVKALNIPVLLGLIFWITRPNIKRLFFPNN